MQLPNFLTAHPDGEIRLSGTRISLADVVDLYNEGYSPEKIYAEFLSPSLEQIKKVIEFYLHNRAKVDSLVAQIHVQAEGNYAKYPASPGMLPVRRLWEVLEEAEAQHAGDPEWARLSLAEKMRRLHLLDDAEETA
jgi:uncharacterized protein (DUF433 family)